MVELVFPLKINEAKVTQGEKFYPFSVEKSFFGIIALKMVSAKYLGAL